MTSIAIDIAIMLGIILMLIGIWEAIFWTVLGKPVKKSKEASDWLNYNTRLFTPTMLYNPFAADNPGDIIYIRIHKPSVFSKYYVETTDGGFRVLRDSELHRKIERKFDRLIKIRNKYTF